ncbi:IQ calmodulin-binding motif protein [Medicago truncatula]|uniref:IQ calmodulin-binding motif protein n=1 Tax=Medicago truncatula TaxID=3880 RepID=A0A072TS31_MEDTR|nr:IQ calmodulin-binding motif protein [Medicago truncatula]
MDATINRDGALVKCEINYVLSNIVITRETTSLTNKDTSAAPNVIEKICTTDFSNEKLQLSSNACSDMPGTIITEIESMVDVNPPESAALIIQASIRGYLVRRALLNSKNVVKLQAVVRGHLVRRHAVGASRHVQAITKMQESETITRGDENRSREPKLHLCWNGLLIERKVVSMPVYGKIEVHNTEIAHDSRLIPPDKLLQRMHHKASILLTDQAVCTLVDACFQVVQQSVNRGDLLQRSSRYTMLELIQAVFARLPEIEANRDGQNLGQFKGLVASDKNIVSLLRFQMSQDGRHHLI